MHCSEINNKIIAIMCERITPMHDFARILSASLGPLSTLTEAPPPSGMAINTMKQLQILADILTTTALVDDKETIMQQVLRNFVSVLTAGYDDSELEVAGLREQAAADLEYVLNSIRRLPVAEQILEGCTQDMRALHLRKISSIKAHKEAQLMAELNKIKDQLVTEQQEQASENKPSPPPSPPPQEQANEEDKEEEREAVSEAGPTPVAVVEDDVEPPADIEIPLD